MLPLYLLTAAKNKPILIELKTGETYNGNLTNCDSWMNLTLHDVIQTNSSGDKFEKLSTIYIKGMHIKYLRIPDQVMDFVKEQQLQYHHNQQHGDRDNRRTKRGNYQSSGGGAGGRGYNRDGGRDNRRGGRYNNQNSNNSNNHNGNNGNRRGHQ
ncbi:uncharacterized protein KGF55_005013 [Candida pseudojiufengensis]|uniref:uncharacterized protein n=1 Tax=Candida pseudojiufengensis TaxID=497109 RepID=UPI0022246C07|nr:uncharacterized protein KGF55_005013 [Candida pseudojiufengensis]KAI5959781.1 hypothetical protein KGF55_005013 [Candida pseudojiufengensis]